MIIPISFHKIVGHSMEPIFKEGEIVVVSRWSYLFHQPKPGDIVALKHPNYRNKILLKKIKKILAGNNFYVEGLNKQDSIDSRNFGSVSKKLILGKVIRKYRL